MICSIIIWLKGRLSLNNGDSPSGKATDSDSVTRGFKSLIPSQKYLSIFVLGYFFVYKLKEGFEPRATTLVEKTIKYRFSDMFFVAISQ